MATFPDFDAIVSSLPAKKNGIRKESATSGTNGLVSLWRSVGSPGVGAKPSTTSGATCSNATAGAMPLPAVSGGKKNHLFSMLVSGTSNGLICLADRLVHSDGLVGNTTSAQTVGTPTLPARAGSGVGVEILVEIYTSTGATPATITASYTNSSGTSGRTASSASGALVSTLGAQRVIQLGLDSGDVGVQSVQSVTLSASTGTAGEFGLALVKTFDAWSLPAGSNSAFYNFAETGLQELADDACLFAWMVTNTGASGRIELDAAWLQKVPG